MNESKLKRFAAQARQDAEDYRKMAAQHRMAAQNLDKAVNDRLSDAEFYERQIEMNRAKKDAA